MPRDLPPYALALPSHVGLMELSKTEQVTGGLKSSEAATEFNNRCDVLMSKSELLACNITLETCQGRPSCGTDLSLQRRSPRIEVRSFQDAPEFDGSCLYEASARDAKPLLQRSPQPCMRWWRARTQGARRRPCRSACLRDRWRLSIRPTAGCGTPWTSASYSLFTLWHLNCSDRLMSRLGFITTRTPEVSLSSRWTTPMWSTLPDVFAWWSKALSNVSFQCPGP